MINTFPSINTSNNVNKSSDVQSVRFVFNQVTSQWQRAKIGTRLPKNIGELFFFLNVVKTSYNSFLHGDHSFHNLFQLAQTLV